MKEIKTTKIYFIAGKARSGKTTAAKILKETYEGMGKKVAILNYAHYLKDYLILYFGWNGKEEDKPRNLLNELGDFIRNDLKEDFFLINRINEDINVLSYFFDIIIVGDVRLVEEIENARGKYNNAIFLRIKREDYENDLNEVQKHHRTETELNNYNNFDYTIDNDESISNFKNSLVDIVKQEED